MWFFVGIGTARVLLHSSESNTNLIAVIFSILEVIEIYWLYLVVLPSKFFILSATKYFCCSSWEIYTIVFIYPATLVGISADYNLSTYNSLIVVTLSEILSTIIYPSNTKLRFLEWHGFMFSLRARLQRYIFANKMLSHRRSEIAASARSFATRLCNCYRQQRLLLLTWTDFNPSMDK